MSNSTVPIRGQTRIPLIERRQGKSSALQMCLESNTVSVQQPQSLSNLETDSAGKELAQKVNKRSPKDRMDPEFQELKGFVELGFVFSKDQLSPRLLNLLPGLKRLIHHENGTEILGFQESALESWELPTPSAAGMEMKENLKLWARYVASTLKC